MKTHKLKALIKSQNYHKRIWELVEQQYSQNEVKKPNQIPNKNTIQLVTQTKSKSKQMGIGWTAALKNSW